jgi:hypothetical protein
MIVEHLRNNPSRRHNIRKYEVNQIRPALFPKPLNLPIEILEKDGIPCLKNTGGQDTTRRLFEHPTGATAMRLLHVPLS